MIRDLSVRLVLELYQWKNKKEYCFLLISVLLWVRIKPIYLNHALCWKCVCTRRGECVRFCVFFCVCVGQQCCRWAPTVWPFVHFISVSETLRALLYFKETFLRFWEGAEREGKDLIFFFLFFLFFFSVWNNLYMGQAEECRMVHPIRFLLRSQAGEYVMIPHVLGGVSLEH